MKTMQRFAAQRLTKRQMNDIKGGAVESALCPAGELLYTCKLLVNGVEFDGGVICAKDRIQANITASSTVIEIGGARYDCH